MTGNCRTRFSRPLPAPSLERSEASCMDLKRIQNAASSAPSAFYQLQCIHDIS